MRGPVRQQVAKQAVEQRAIEQDGLSWDLVLHESLQPYGGAISGTVFWIAAMIYGKRDPAGGSHRDEEGKGS